MDLRNRTRAQYARLLQTYAALPADTPCEQRWTWLMAAHVAGQPVLALHLDSHLHMLRLAWRTGDRVEAAGQLLRLALVPLGHAFGRLPAGNVGRATVSAFRPMRPPREVRRALAWARRGGP
ncbi:MAG TPA: DUF3703 domain-containing protein [Ramlibacter sp.]|jgi:hypothetical protein